MPEAYNLFTPDALKEKDRLYAIKRCAPHRIPDLYLKIYPASKIANLIALERCSVDRLEELYGMISSKDSDIKEVMFRRCGAEQLNRLGLLPGEEKKQVTSSLTECLSPMDVLKAFKKMSFKKIAKPSREDIVYAIRKCDPVLIPELLSLIADPAEEIILMAVNHCLSSEIPALAAKIPRLSARIINALISECDDSLFHELLKVIPFEPVYVRQALKRCSPDSVPELMKTLDCPTGDLLDTAFAVCQPWKILDLIKNCPGLSEEHMVAAVVRCSDDMLVELGNHISLKSPGLMALYRQRLESYRKSLNEGVRILALCEKELLSVIARAQEEKEAYDKKRETSPFVSELSSDSYHVEGRITDRTFDLNDARREMEAVKTMLAEVEEVLNGL